MTTPPTTMSCLSWNCRGLGSSRAIQDLKMLIRSQKSDVIFLMETRILQKKFISLKVQLGFSNGFMVERIGPGGGLIMLWKEDLDVTLVSFSSGHIDVWINNWLSTGRSFLTGFYGNWNTALRRHSWTLLKRIGENRHLSWCISGDFNELLYSYETTSNLGRSESQLQAFHELILALELKKIFMEGANFTWWNKRKGATSVHAKLDRCFWNPTLSHSNLSARVHVLPTITSDHHALVVCIKKVVARVRYRGRPSRMEPWWLEYEEGRKRMEMN